MVTETDRNKARSAVLSAYLALDCVGMSVPFLYAFADAAVDAVSTDAEPVAYGVFNKHGDFQFACVSKADAEKGKVLPGDSVRPLYAEPVKTAPAVAVKALEWTPWPGNDLTINGQTSRRIMRRSNGAGVAYSLEREQDHAGNWYVMKFWDQVAGPFKTDLDAMKWCAQDHENRILSALSAQVQDVADLETRMKAAGMYSIAEMMGVTPLTKWKSNPAINTIEAFADWLDRKTSEYLAMKAGYDLGDKSEDDELFEWVLAHAGVFSTIRDQFRIVTASPASKHGDAE